MNNFNRILSFVLCILMCFSFSAVVFAATPVELSVNLDTTQAEEGKLPTTVSLFVGTTNALSIMSFSAEAYASDPRITISKIEPGDVDLISNTSTGRFAFIAVGEASVSSWATVEFSIPADLPAGTYTFGVQSASASKTDNSNPLAGTTGGSATLTVTPAPTVITSFDLGVTAPAYNGTPATGVLDASFSAPINWTPNDTAFQAGTAYTASVSMTAADGYKFTADNFANYFLGQSISVNSCDGVSLSADGKTLSFSYSYPVVAKPSITITEDDITIADAGKYTGSPKEPAVTVDGLSSDDFIVTYNNNTNAGNAASVTVSPAPNGTYTFAPVTKNFSIARAEQTISASDVTVFVGAGEVDLGAGMQAEGAITISVDGTVPSGTTVDVQAKKMNVGNTSGTFKLTLNAAETVNYEAATKQITVTISDKANANVSINNAPASKTYGDSAFTLTATAANTGSNGKWTWTSSNPSVLTVSNTGVVTVVAAGSATITAKYESDTTIGSAAVTIPVEKAAQAITGAHITVQVGKTVNLSSVFSAQGAISYSISGGASISGGVLIAGNTPGVYDLTVTAAATENYKAATAGFKVTVKAEEVVTPILPPMFINYTLSFDTNGGSVIAPITKISHTTVDLGAYVPVKSGYEFAGWYADKALSEKVTSVKLTKDMTVYAKWTQASAADKPCDGGVTCPSFFFTDVDQSLWYHAGIDFVVANKMMNGVGDNKFDPHGTASRAMIVTILYRLEGQPKVTAENPFDDVEEDTWYTDAVIWAEAKGIVNGYGDDKFGPNDEITREQMAKIMFNYADYKKYDISARASLASFTDADKISSWASEEMKWAVASGLINGMGDGTIAPQGDAERCQVAAIFMRFCEKFVK